MLRSRSRPADQALCRACDAKTVRTKRLFKNFRHPHKGEEQTGKSRIVAGRVFQESNRYQGMEGGDGLNRRLAGRYRDLRDGGAWLGIIRRPRLLHSYRTLQMARHASVARPVRHKPVHESADASAQDLAQCPGLPESAHERVPAE